MADSVDRVFGHALNTVNKIRTGSSKPPVSSRLRLYGLYKQSMEGDVRYIQPRPSLPTTSSTSSPSPSASATAIEATRKEAEKWDAWNANTGLSRTEAKKRYIETLIETMHAYASTTPEARELVAELEFVWDQVRNNSQADSGSSQSSPAQMQAREGGEAYPGMAGRAGSGNGAAAFDRGRGTEGEGRGKGKMRVLSPVSQGQDEVEEEEEREEFVDAPVSQFGEMEADTQGDERQDTREGAADDRPPDSKTRRAPMGELKWRRRIESALVKMTTEVAALREQLESRRYITQQRRHSFFGWVLRLGWFLVRSIVLDVFVLFLVLLYLRRKKDRRLEGAVRVLLGDAVAQISKASREVKMPKLPTIKS